MGDFEFIGDLGKCGTCGYPFKIAFCGAGSIWCPNCHHSCIMDDGRK